MAALAVCFLLCVFCATSTVAINPGIKVRITAGGVNQVNQIALNLLASKIQGSTVDDQKGKAHHVHYELTHLLITQFIKPQTSTTFVPSKGLMWRGTNANIDIYGHWKYKVKIGKHIKIISDHGHFDVKVLRISFALTITIGVDANGRPTITPAGCSTDIGSVHLNIHGGKAKYYNPFKSMVESNIKHSLQKKLCDAVNDEVNKNAKDMLSKLNVTYDFLGSFKLDYRLLSPPLFQKDYMELYDKGEVFWKQDKSEAPFQPQPFPASNATQKMIYVWISDYAFKTFAFQAQKHGYLSYNVTPQNVPAAAKGYLNTTCTSGKCIGTLIPQIGKLYPNQMVSLRLSSLSVPKINISNQIEFSGQGEISMYVKNSVHLLTLNTTIRAAVKVSVSNQKILASAGTVKVQTKVVKSSVGTISALTLVLLDTAVSGLITTEINEMGKIGFPLPTIYGVRLSNSQILYGKDSIIFATDISYKANSTYLKFQPFWRLKKISYPTRMFYPKRKHFII